MGTLGTLVPAARPPHRLFAPFVSCVAPTRLSWVWSVRGTTNVLDCAQRPRNAHFRFFFFFLLLLQLRCAVALPLLQRLRWQSLAPRNLTFRRINGRSDTQCPFHSLPTKPLILDDVCSRTRFNTNLSTKPTAIFAHVSETKDFDQKCVCPASSSPLCRSSPPLKAPSLRSPLLTGPSAPRLAPTRPSSPRL